MLPARVLSCGPALMVWVCLCVCGGPAAAQPSEAAPPPGDSAASAEEATQGGGLSANTVPADPQDQLPLGPIEAGDGGVDTGRSSAAPTGGWVMNTLAALGVVIGLIFLMRWLARKSGVGGGVRVSSSPVVEVLSRTNVAPRNHVVLLRVGSRVLVVNDGVGGMRTLATVDDPDEVAGLLQSVQVARDTSMSNSFGKVMSKLSGQWSSAEDAGELGSDDAEAGIDRARGSVAGLRDRLRLSGGGGA